MTPSSGAIGMTSCNRHDVISGPQANANNSETVRDRPKVIINRNLEVWVCPSETVLTFDIQRHLAERMALRHL